MNINDIELKVLRGCPIDIGIGKIHPLSLGEIAEEIGEYHYNYYLSLVISSKDNVVIENHTLTPLQVLCVYCYQQEDFRESFLKAMLAFFKEELYFHKDGYFYFGKLEENRIFEESHYEQFKLIIKKQNFLIDKREEEFKPHNDRARELIEKRKQIINKIKKENNDNGLNLSDIISIVSAYMPNVSIFSVWDLTVYQLYTLYMRLIMKENYDSQLYLLPHSADPNSTDLKHWAAKLDMNNNK